MSPTWRSFLRNHMADIVAVDMFVVATATFRLFYALVVLGHDRRTIIHFEVTPKSHPSLARTPNDRGLSVRRRAALSAARPGRIMRSDLPRSRAGDGNQGGRNCAADVASYAAGYDVGPADAV
jgi:hypothetical protein